MGAAAVGQRVLLARRHHTCPAPPAPPRPHHWPLAADVTRIHSLYYEDEDVMQAVFDRDQAAHYIFARPGMLSRLADHVRGVEEVSLIADPMRITLQSYNNLGDASTGAYVVVGAGRLAG